ncbi:hypothetical protein NEHOM01_0964 [Nematocida homosporus]|uniref:uncharacterized protein n=1 Tax=Nematocida homosporus TaxID=1912981 RepID=UPI00221FC0AE|nr:uncharacterized protein NEHOM01_0964 [Nematocida homosporus]KAI5185638.1 hypothetical protein NEHOM01_0964 [Nematocida homosporus]
MQCIGRLFNRDWLLPIRALSLRLILRSCDREECWRVQYWPSPGGWTVNGQPIKERDSIELLFEGRRYFLVLFKPSLAYLQGIEVVARIIQHSPNQEITGRVLLRRLKREDKLSQTPDYYLQILKESKCFIKIKTEDTLGNRQTIWRLNSDQIKNFVHVKLARQTILIESTGQRESISLFYTDYPDINQKANNQKANVEIGITQKGNTKKGSDQNDVTISDIDKILF